jgi:hypothetical protein
VKLTTFRVNVYKPVQHTLGNNYLNKPCAV